MKGNETFLLFKLILGWKNNLKKTWEMNRISLEFLYLSKASEVLTLAHDGAGMVRCLESDRQRPSLAQAFAETIRQTNHDAIVSPVPWQSSSCTCSNWHILVKRNVLRLSWHQAFDPYPIKCVQNGSKFRNESKWITSENSLPFVLMHCLHLTEELRNWWTTPAESSL